MKLFKNNRFRCRYLLVLLAACLITSCADFVEIDPPRTSLPKVNVFASDATAEAAVVEPVDPLCGRVRDSVEGALRADELARATELARTKFSDDAWTSRVP